MKERNVLKKVNRFAYDYERTRVPGEKTRSWWDLAFVEIGLWVSGFAVLSGTLFAASGMSLIDVIIAIFVGNGILCALHILMGIIGVKERVIIDTIAKKTLGELGAKILSILLLVITVGFAALGLEMIAQGITEALGISITITAWIAACVILLSALGGYKTISALSKISIPFFLIVVPILSIAAIISTDGPIWGIARDYGGSFTIWSGITYNVGMGVTATLLSPNITRYAHKTKDVGLLYVIASFLGGALIIFLSGAMGVYANTNNIYDIFYICGGELGILLFILAVWTTADNDYYHGTLAATNLYENIPRWVYTLAFVTLSVLLIYANFLGKLVEWCNFLSILIPPYIGIVICDYYVLSKIGLKRINEQRAKKINITAFISWALGIITAYYVTNTFEILPSIFGLVVAFVVYLAFSVVIDTRQKGVSE